MTMIPIDSLYASAVRAMLRVAVGLGLVVVAVQLLKFAYQPSLAPAAFAIALSAGMLALARSSAHLFRHHGVAAKRPHTR